jgi:heme-degrading monooxygenase HmoA
MVTMAFVAINVLTVPDGNGAVLEERFAARAGSVERADGFERFELLRPVEGTDQYLVYTRWRDQQSFDAWTASRSFAAGHAQASGRPADQAPAASGSTIWSFEVAQSADPVAAGSA